MNILPKNQIKKEDIWLIQQNKLLWTATRLPKIYGGVLIIEDCKKAPNMSKQDIFWYSQSGSHEMRAVLLDSSLI